MRMMLDSNLFRMEKVGMDEDKNNDERNNLKV